MDPLTVISLASAIVQFVGFSSSVICGIREVYSSVSGATAQSDEAVQAVEHLGDLTRRLPRVVPTLALTPDERRLLDLQEGCETISEEFRKILQAGRAKTPRSLRSSLRATCKLMRNKKKIANLQSKLDRCRGEVLGVPQALMRYATKIPVLVFRWSDI